MISLESLLEQAAGSFPFPPAPDLAAGVMARLELPAATPSFNRRRLALAAAAVLVVLAGLLAVPEVRAAVLEALRIGAVRIFLDAPTAQPAPQLLATETPQATAPVDAQPTFAPATTPWAAGMDGETTLEEAASRIDFPIRLPTYPPDAGPPDQVFLPRLEGPAVVLAWNEPGNPSQLRFALYQLGRGVLLGKGQPQSFEEFQVNGNRALWITGAHEMVDLSRNRGATRVVEANVLIWEEGQITYRLETWLDVEEALRIAESLQSDTSDR